MSGRIAVKVAVKIRPLNQRESREEECTIVRKTTDDLRTLQLGKDGKVFTYDWVIAHSEPPKCFYDRCVRSLVSGLFEGFNATVLAYGQTGSGKTYSMGTSGRMTEIPEENLGVVPRAARQIFEKIDEIKEMYADKRHKPVITVQTQFLELYQDVPVDLYNPTAPAPKILAPASGIEIKSQIIPAATPQEVLDLLLRGAANRQVGGTRMNAESSRSHAMFLIFITQNFVDLEQADDEDEVKPQTLTAKFCLVDLAGSERLSKTGAEGGRKEEGIAINKGLLSLGNVISALGNPKKNAPINYRDTKLTFLLKDSLGGNSQTLMIACISPSAGEKNETRNTLEYANRARNIKNTPKKNQDETSIQVAKLKEEIQKLRKILKECKCGIAEASQIEKETEDESEVSSEKLEDPSPMSERGSLLATPRPPSTTCTTPNEGLHSSIQPAELASPCQDVQSVVYIHKNELLEASVSSLKLTNRHISRELADIKTKLDLYKMRREAKSEEDLDTRMTQLLYDYQLKNERLREEMYKNKKYYNLLDEYLKKRDTSFQRFESQPDRNVEDILTLAKRDVERRQAFYESLPDNILKPRPKRKRKRTKLRKNATQQSCPLPRQESICLFKPSDFDNASSEALAIMRKAEDLHSRFVDEQFNGKRKMSRRNSGTVKSIERRGSGALVLNDNNTTSCQLPTVQKTKVSENQTPDNHTNLVKQLEPGVFTESENTTISYDDTMGSEHGGDTEDTRKLFKMKCMKKSDTITTLKEQEETSIYKASEEQIEEDIVVQKAEAQHQRKKSIKLKEIISEKSVEQEDTLYSASDYEGVSGAVLVMMQKAEAEYQKKKAIANLKTRKESEKSVEKTSVEQEDTLYSASDYEGVSGAVLVMMQNAEAEHQKKKAIANLKTRKESEKSVEKTSVEQEDTLYSASDYEGVSGAVLVMMQKAEAEHQKKKAIANLKTRKKSEKSMEKTSDEQEDTLYTASDYEGVSGAVLVMMQKAEAEHQKKKAIANLKTRKESEKSVEKTSDEQEDTLYSASDYEGVSGAVLVMMQKAEAEYQKKKAIANLKKRKESEKSMEKASIEQEDTLYSASDYEGVSGEVLVMMDKAEAAHQKKKAILNFEKMQESQRITKQDTTTRQKNTVTSGNNNFSETLQKADSQEERETVQEAVKEKEITVTRHVKPTSLHRQFIDSRDYVDTPDEIFSSPGLSRTVGTTSLRDLKVSSNESGSNQDSPDSEFSPLEQRIGNILNEEPRTSTIQTIEPGNYASSELHLERDLVSSLPEEDQASQDARVKPENTEAATVRFQTPPAESSYQEPEYSQYTQCYLSSSGDDSYETDSDCEDLDLNNPNNTILNPDVALVLEDLAYRKGLIRQMEKDRLHNATLTKQSGDRIRQLQIKINSMETDTEGKDKLKNEYKKKTAELEKKCSKLTEQFSSEQKRAGKSTSKISALEQDSKKWKEAYEKSQTENKRLAASIKKMESLSIDQSKKIKHFEKKHEKDEQIQKETKRDMDNLIKKTKNDKGKSEKLIEEKNKKITGMERENSKLKTNIKESLNKFKELTKSIAKTKTTSKKEKVESSTNKKKPNVPSLREAKEQGDKDKQQSLQIIENVLTNLLHKPDISQKIKMMVERRVSQHVEVKKREVLKRQATDKKIVQKEMKALLPEVKTVVGSAIPQDVVAFVAQMDERRVKRTLELMFLCMMYDKIVNRIKALEEEKLNIEKNQLCESAGRMEKVKNFIKNEIILSNGSTDTPRNRRYSLNDSTDVKIILSESLLLPPQGETNSKSKSPQNTRKLKSSPTKPPLVPNLTTNSGGVKRQNAVTSMSASNQRASSLKQPSRSAFQARPIRASSAASKSAPRSPTKVQSVAPHSLSVTTSLKSPIKKVFSESVSPLVLTAKSLDQESADSVVFSPITPAEGLTPILDSPIRTESISLVSLPISLLSNAAEQPKPLTNDTSPKLTHTNTPSESPINDILPKLTHTKTPSQSPINDIPPKLTHTKTPSQSPTNDIPPKLTHTNTPSQSPTNDIPPKLTHTNTPSQSPTNDIPPKLTHTNTPSQSPTNDTPTNNTPTNDTPPKLAHTNTPSQSPTNNTPPKFLTTPSSSDTTEPNSKLPINSSSTSTPSISPTPSQSESSTNSDSTKHTDTTPRLQSKLPTHTLATRLPSRSVQSPTSSRLLSPTSHPRLGFTHHKLSPPSHSITKTISIPTPSKPHAVSQSSIECPKPKPVQSKGADLLKPMNSIKLNPRSPTLSFLLEDDCFIYSTPNCYIRFLDLETLSETSALDPKKLGGVARSMEYRYSDKLLFTICGKKVQIFDTRNQEPIFQLKNTFDHSNNFQSLTTTHDPNVICVTCGSDIITWDFMSNKLVSKIKSNTPVITTLYCGVKKDNTPFTVTSCRDRTMHIFDNPESFWSLPSQSSLPSMASVSSLSSVSSDMTPTNSLSELSLEFPAVSQDPSPITKGRSHNKPLKLDKFLWDTWSSLAHYNNTLLFSNGNSISQYNLLNMSFVKKTELLLPGNVSSDITFMTMFPNQPFIVTSCRKSSIRFLDPLKLTPYSKNNYHANCQFLYSNGSKMKMSCNNSMIATTCNMLDVKLWKVNLDYFN